jgi:hypothetical protein
MALRPALFGIVQVVRLLSFSHFEFDFFGFSCQVFAQKDQDVTRLCESEVEKGGGPQTD